MKKDVLIKTALNKSLWGSAFGGIVGAVPGAIDLIKKKNTSDSLKKMLIGAGIGGTLGHIGTNLSGDIKNNLNHNTLGETFANPTKKFSGSLVLGIGIGSIPGAVKLLNAHKQDTEELRSAERKKAIRMMFAGSSIGTGFSVGNSILHNLFKEIKQ